MHDGWLDRIQSYFMIVAYLTHSHYVWCHKTDAQHEKMHRHAQFYISLYMRAEHMKESWPQIPGYIDDVNFVDKSSLNLSSTTYLIVQALKCALQGRNIVGVLVNITNINHCYRDE